ncbi:MAG: hypothetical protein ACKOQM_00010 [Novosphingobium sp.]
MKPALALILFAVAGPALAVPGGPIGQLDPGAWHCELPGDAGGAVGLHVAGEDFEIVNANTYRTAAGRGTYLLTGDMLTFTSGPKYGETFHRITTGFMRKSDANGADTTLRCVRRVVNNG